MLDKLKDDILRLLKEDEEFRYAVIGLLGLQRLEEAISRLTDSHIELKSIVSRLVDIQANVEARLARVEEEQVSIRSRMDRLEEAIVRLTESYTELKNTVLRLVDIQTRQEERLTKLEEAWIRSEERLAKVEERLVNVEERLEEHDKKFNEIVEELKVHRLKLEEHDKKFNEIMEEIRDLRRVSNEHTVMLRNMQGMMLHGFEQMGRFAGISLESLVRSMLTKVMQDRDELPKDKELTSITIDSEEIDVFCDDPLIVGEVTNYADSIDEISKLVKKVKLVKDRFNKDPEYILLIITNIKREVYEDMVREAEANRIEVIIGKRV